MDCTLIYLPVTKTAQHFAAQPRQLVPAGLSNHLAKGQWDNTTNV